MILKSVSELTITPKRIVSLVPSQTELLHYLGLNGETVGITKFCIHPDEWFRTKTRIGGTKNLDIECIKSLDPDLIIANKEENTRKQVEELAKEFNVWVSDVNSLDSAVQMIQDIGTLTDKTIGAGDLVNKIHAGFRGIKTSNPPRKTCYLIWKDPYMTIGGDTYINNLMNLSGFENIFAGKKRYPELSVEQINAFKPELIMLSSEPYPFKQKDIAILQQQIPGTKIILVNGEMFSWYGSRMALIPAYLNELISLVNSL